MQLRTIALYSHSGEIRRVEFNAGGVSIITGASKTGKSAIIEIIDYCLGRESFNVPVGRIRDSVKWYSLLMHFPSVDLFVARQSPGEGESSKSAIYLRTGRDLEIPAVGELVENSTAEALGEQLGSLLGIAPNLNVNAWNKDDSASFAVSARQSLFFTFQQQDEIASKKILFHRQAEEFIPRSIRQTLPYFVGAVEEDRLIKLNRLQALYEELAVVSAQVADHERTAGRFDQARFLAKEAQEVGLVDIKDLPEKSEDLHKLLSSVAEETENSVPSLVEDERDSLQQSRFHLLREYRDIRDEIQAAEKFEEEQVSYLREGRVQQRRLESVGLFSENGMQNCPICESKLNSAPPSVEAILGSLQDLSARLKPVVRDVANVRAHVEQLQEKVSTVRSRIDDNWRELSALSAARKAVKDQQDAAARRAYMRGRVSLYLQSRTALLTDGGLSRRVDEIRKQTNELESALNREEIEEQLTAIFNSIGSTMSVWGKELNLEFANSPLRIDPKKLTVVADTPKGPIPLDKMGSGENWVGYHVVAMLALHLHFINQERPVPRFLILDQPSQVHFPQEKTSENLSQHDEDEVAVGQLYRFLFSRARELKEKFQIIVVDHADLADDDFQKAIVQRWRKGNALIPDSWASAPSV